MALFSAAPLPSLASLFDEFAVGGLEAPAPLPSLATLLSTRTGRLLLADAGTYSVSGKAVNLKSGRKFAANYGTYALTGGDVGFYYVSLGSGLEAPAPLPSLASLFSGSSFAAAVGASSPLPSLSTLFERASTDKLMTLGVGSYAQTGSDVSFFRGVALTCDTGTYTYEGADADRDLEIDTEKGTYSVTGQPITFVYRTGELALSGSYTLTGNAISFLYVSRNPYHAPGHYALGGGDITFRVTRLPGGWRGSGGVYVGPSQDWLLDRKKRKKKRKKVEKEDKPDYL